MSTIVRPAEAKLVRERPRFVACAMPVASVGEGEERRALLRREHHAARHIPYAHQLLAGEARSGDDGEPRGLARAYRDAAREALAEAGVRPRGQEKRILTVALPDRIGIVLAAAGTTGHGPSLRGSPIGWRSSWSCPRGTHPPPSCRRPVG